MERVRPEIRFDDDCGGGGDDEGGRTGCDGDGSDGGSGHYSCGDGGDGNSIGDACRTYVIAHFGAATNTGVGSRSDPPPVGRRQLQHGPTWNRPKRCRWCTIPRPSWP